MKKNKGLFTLTTIAIIVGFALVSYNQSKNNELDAEMNNMLITANFNTNVVHKNMVVNNVSNNENYFDLVKKDLSLIALNIENLNKYLQTISDTAVIRNNKISDFNSLLNDYNSLQEYLNLILNNKEILLEINKISSNIDQSYQAIKTNNFILENEIRKTIQENKNNDFYIKRASSLLDIVHRYFDFLTTVNADVLNGDKINNNIKEIDKFITYLSNIELDKKSINLNRELENYLTLIKDFKDKYSYLNNKKTEVLAVQSIKTEEKRAFEKINLIQFKVRNNLRADFDYTYFFIINAIFILIFSLSLLYSINTTAELSKKDSDKIKQYEVLNRRTRNVQKEFAKTINKDEETGVVNINVMGIINEDQYRESKLGIIVNRFNILLRTYVQLKTKIEKIGKSVQEQIVPLLNNLPMLKRETSNSEMNYGIGEIKLTEDALEDLNKLISYQDGKLDGINSNSQNILLKIDDTKGAISDNQKKLDEIRKNMQNSSKQVKKTGELLQDNNVLHEEIKQFLSQIGVITLNLAIEASKSDNASFITYANELQKISESISDLLNKSKSNNTAIFSSVQDTTNLLEITTNEIVADNDLLDKTQLLVLSVEKTLDNVLKNGSEAFENIEKIQNYLKLLNEKILILKEKDIKKSKIIIDSEETLSKLLEVFNAK